MLQKWRSMVQTIEGVLITWGAVFLKYFLPQIQCTFTFVVVNSILEECARGLYHRPFTFHVLSFFLSFSFSYIVGNYQCRRGSYHLSLISFSYLDVYFVFPMFSSYLNCHQQGNQLMKGSMRGLYQYLSRSLPSHFLSFLLLLSHSSSYFFLMN